jgi:hypothetical protein
LAKIDPNTGLGVNNYSGYLANTTIWRRHHQLRKNYGITLVQWEEIFDKQGRVCAICGTDQPRGKNWHTDHDHSTKLIRGILCGWCNTGIGKLQESEEIMLKALKYLKQETN